MALNELDFLEQLRDALIIALQVLFPTVSGSSVSLNIHSLKAHLYFQKNTLGKFILHILVLKCVPPGPALKSSHLGLLVTIHAVAQLQASLVK